MSRLNNLNKEEWARYNKTVWNCCSSDGYFASFDKELPKRLIRYFTFPGDTVLDPFVGSGTTLEAAQETGRNAVGIDCSLKAIGVSKKKINPRDNLSITAMGGDARDLSRFGKNEFDFIVTSPPYFDIVRYSTDNSQIGNLKDYGEFIENVIIAFEECRRVLKLKKYLSVITADIRKAHQYYPTHIDYINRLGEIGFKLHQIMINEFKSSGFRTKGDCSGNNA
ncbi:MAG: DNA methyltransferase [Euryarchaeota archaeon]|nr:DNA methyltransferase [Euryarchaeota archaeon]